MTQTALVDPNVMLRSIVDLMATRKKGCRFATVVYRSKETDELAKHSLRLGVNFEAMYQKDVDLLRNMLPTLTQDGLKYQACASILASLEESLAVGIGNNSKYTLRGHFHTSPAFPGVKLLMASDTTRSREVGLYITAICEKKTVIEAGVHRTVNSAPLTVAKNEIRAMLRTNKVRTFHLRNVTRLAMSGSVLTLEGV